MGAAVVARSQSRGVVQSIRSGTDRLCTAQRPLQDFGRLACSVGEGRRRISWQRALVSTRQPRGADHLALPRCPAGAVKFADVQPDPYARIPGGQLGFIAYSCNEDAGKAAKALDGKQLAGA